MRPASTNGTDAPSWKQRLHEEELNGFAFAFKARSVALVHLIAIDRKVAP